MKPTDRERVLRLARRREVLTPTDVTRAGLHTQNLTRLVADGSLERIARGQYRVPESPISEHHGLAMAARAIPRGVICLISALAFHEVGSQLPAAVWIAVDRRARAPRMSYPPLRVVRFAGRALTEGIETHRVEGQQVRLYSVAKTLADLFKYRNKIGIEVALEALRDAWQKRRVTMEEIDHFARICRVERVMRPYLEALVA